MPAIEVCLTPELIYQFDLKGKIVVVVDIFRATSCMVTGLAHGIQSIHPVAEVEECLALGRQGLITAGERGGQKVDGFDIGNSPFEYMQESFRGKSVVVSTTNGTLTILASRPADEILIGAFLNLNALASYLASKDQDLIIHCAGWKGTVNIEDTLFAGALIHQLAASHQWEGDPAMLAHELYAHNQHDLLRIARASSHARRLAGFGVERDLAFCLEIGRYEVIPRFDQDRLVPLAT